MLQRALIFLTQTLRGFVFSSTMFVAVLAFTGAALSATLLYEHLLDQRTRESSAQIARQAYLAVQDALRQPGGHREAQRLIDTFRLVFPQNLDSIRIRHASRETLAQLQRDGQQVEEVGGLLRYTYPLVASAECQSCHLAAARPGEAEPPFGTVVIDYQRPQIAAESRLHYIALFAVLGMLALLTSLAVSLSSTRKIRRSLDLLGERVAEVNSIRDVERLQLNDVDLGFHELNETFTQVGQLVQRLKDVAVDRDILEFEISLLEKLIITTNVVKDWRAFIKNLLVEINQIVDAYALVTIFKVDEEAYECEVFWRYQPTATTRRLFETVLQRRLDETPFMSEALFLPVVHNVADNEGEIELGEREIELQTKSLVLETPRIGGIAGIGLQTTILATDNVRKMVIGSILTAMLNLVGSVKAIFKYTKDLEHYATRDPLTGLYNQRMFWELLAAEEKRVQRSGASFALVVIDLDNFKQVNDAYGHHVGDTLLQTFAERLKQVVRQVDQLCRYGGDEFCVILPEADEAEAHSVARRVADMLEHFVCEAPDGAPLKATASIGIAVYPQHGNTPKDIFLIADNMMYKAKRSGKNAIAAPNADELAEAFRKLAEKMAMIQRALEQRRIVPYFQPICAVGDGQVEIHELLMSIDLDGRIVPAGEFIAEAERMGIVHQMDYQLIEKAFARIREDNYRGMLFVNLSPKSLIVGEFVSKVKHLTGVYGIDPGQVVFEITERETVSNLAVLETFVLELKEQGFCFAIDDFGSGYSSFHYIKHFPVDFIKIEGEFVRNIVDDEVYRAFVKSISTLARELKMRTIAEFVEDEHILHELQTFGIDYAQGYHLGRPRPALHPAGTRLPEGA